MQFLCDDRSRRCMLIVDGARLILDFAGHFLNSLNKTLGKYHGTLVIRRDIGLI